MSDPIFLCLATFPHGVKLLNFEAKPAKIWFEYPRMIWVALFRSMKTKDILASWLLDEDDAWKDIWYGLFEFHGLQLFQAFWNWVHVTELTKTWNFEDLIINYIFSVTLLNAVDFFDPDNTYFSWTFVLELIKKPIKGLP